ERLSIVGADDVDDVLVAAGRLAAADHELGGAPVRARVDAAVAERAEELDPLRVARLAEDGDGGLAFVGVVGPEIGQRSGDLGGRRGAGRVARRSHGEPHDQRKENGETDHAFFWYVPSYLTQSP